MAFGKDFHDETGELPAVGAAVENRSRPVFRSTQPRERVAYRVEPIGRPAVHDETGTRHEPIDCIAPDHRR